MFSYGLGVLGIYLLFIKNISCMKSYKKLTLQTTNLGVGGSNPPRCANFLN